MIVVFWATGPVGATLAVALRVLERHQKMIVVFWATARVAPTALERFREMIFKS